MSAKYKSPSFLLPNELNTSANTANDTGINSLYSMDFDGSNYIDTGFVPADNLTLDCSISAWVNMPAIGNNTNSSILGTYDFTDNRPIGGQNRARFFLRIYRESGVYYYMVGLGTVPQDMTISISNFSVDTWVHLLVTYDGTDIKLYSNGDLDGTLNVGNIGSYPPINASFNGNTYIGATHRTVSKSDPTSAVESYLTGQIDEVAIFNRALNTTEIAALYEGTSPNIYPSNLMATNLNPIAYYPLGEQAQNSGYPNNPTPANNVWQFPNGVLQDYVMDFDGSDDLINLNDNILFNSGSPFSCSFWCNVNSYSSNTAYPGIFTLKTNQSTGFMMFLSTASGYTGVNFGSNSSFYRGKAGSASDIPVNTWLNVILTYDGVNPALSSSYKIFINGDLKSISGSGGYSTVPNVNRIGKSDNHHFDGKLSNIAIWNTDQSANIANIYNNGSPQTSYTVTPQNWWKLNADSVYTPSAPNYTTALSFNGSSDFIDTGNDSSLNPTSQLTLSVWVKRIGSGTGANPCIYSSSKSSSHNGGFLLETGINRFSFYVDTTGSGGWVNIVNNANLVNNQWYHVVCIWDGSNIKMYVDGVLQTNTASVTQIVYSTDISATIGKYVTSYFNGEISNVAIYNSALTSSQISTLFNFGTPETNISFDPQAWWKLDDQNTITDYSGNGNTGTNNGATDISSGVAVTPSWKIPSALPITTPNYTTALDFVASQSDYIDTNSTFSSLTSFSISAWFKADVTNAFVKSIVSTRINALGSSQGLDIYINSNELVGRVYNNVETEVTTSFTDITSWHHVVLTYNGTTLEFYLDGSSLGTSTGSYTNSGVNLLIGQWTKQSGYNFDGEISNVSIFNSGLTPSQVSTLYNGGTPETAISFSPVSWWKLDTGGSTITDYGSGGNNGTNNGATQVTSDVLTPQPVNGVSTTLPSTALQQSDLQFDSPYSNYSLSFDGATYIDCGNDSILTPTNGISISLWLKTSNTANYRGLIDKWSSNTGYMLHLGPTGSNQGKPVFAIGGQSNIVSSTAVNDGNWHHITVTCDNITSYIYVDGVQTGTGSLTMSGISNSDNLKIAGDNASTFYLNGKIDETSMFNYALSSAQILEIYNNGRPKDLSTFSGTAPVSWWRLGENAYFDNNSFIVPNSISGAPNGTGSGTVTSMLSSDAPGTYANGIGDGLAITDRVGDAPLSVANSQSYNMIPDDKIPYVPGYVGNQISNTYSMTFDGTDYLTLPTSIDLGQTNTISFWVYYPAIGFHIVTGDPLLSNNYGIFLNNGNDIIYQTTVGMNKWSVSPTLNDWTHLVFTKNNTDTFGKLYLNGVLQTIASGSNNIASGVTKFNTIGAKSNGTTGFVGKLDEFAAWDTELTADQIKNDIYNASLPLSSNKTADLANNPNLPTPVAWYRMGD